ncbi:hypothetical protein B7486_11100 [cyanobacterium TDX16]|nr:hypothetical protein B7486_11100 [cyanobacterium TDX16]
MSLRVWPPYGGKPEAAQPGNALFGRRAIDRASVPDDPRQNRIARRIENIKLPLNPPQSPGHVIATGKAATQEDHLVHHDALGQILQRPCRNAGACREGDDVDTRIRVRSPVSTNAGGELGALFAVSSEIHLIAGVSEALPGKDFNGAGVAAFLKSVRHIERPDVADGACAAEVVGDSLRRIARRRDIGDKVHRLSATGDGKKQRKGE